MSTHYNKNENAVSQVIGVILMVAITVILAAVIAAFVFGMAGDLHKSKVVSVTVHRVNSTAVSLTNMGGQDVTALVPDGIAISGAGAGTLGSPVGSTTTVIVGTSPAHVIVTGSFDDGSYQVLLDTEV